MRKRVLGAIILSAVMPVMLAGCGKQETETPVTGTVTGGQTEVTEKLSDSSTQFPFGQNFYDGRWYMEDLVEPSSKTTAATIYSQMTYTEEMFQGDYRLNHVDDSLAKSYATQDFIDTVTWWNASNVSSLLPADESISTVPYRFVAGIAELDNALVTDTEHHWCDVYFATKSSNTGVEVMAAYEVEGNTITITPLAEWNFNEETSELTYSFQDKSFSYTFAFDGPRITFSNDSIGYTLIERDFTAWSNVSVDKSISVKSNLSENSSLIDKIVGIDFTIYVDGNYKMNVNKSSFSLTTLDSDNNQVSCNGIARWDEDGLFTFSYQDASGATYSNQMVMFYCGFDGVVLSDGTKNYYYMSTYLSEFTANYYTPEQLEEIVDGLGANLSEEDQELLGTMTEEEIEEIIETRTDLLADLTVAFEEKGIKAEIDEESGEIVLDSSILFATGQSSLSADGEKALTDFITAFAGVISEDKYDGFISEVEVQGHTDTDGDYDMNLELSQKRADSVRDYCLNDVDELDDSTIAKLETLLVPVGYSYDYPVYNEDGTVDMAASRRVEFIFFINLARRTEE